MTDDCLQKKLAEEGEGKGGIDPGKREGGEEENHTHSIQTEREARGEGFIKAGREFFPKIEECRTECTETKNRMHREEKKENELAAQWMVREGTQSST